MKTEEMKGLGEAEEIVTPSDALDEVGQFHDALLTPQKAKKKDMKAAKENYAAEKQKLVDDFKAAKKAIKEHHGRKKDKGDVRIMSAEEKIYKTMKRSANLNLILGIISIVAGVATGVLLIISGARLHVKKTDILF